MEKVLETEKFVFSVFPEFSSSDYTKFRESECCSDQSYCEASEKYNSSVNSRISVKLTLMEQSSEFMKILP